MLRHWLRTAAFWLVLAAPPAALSGPPPAADFARWPEVRGVVVSPSNTHAAMLVPVADGRVGLAVVDLTDLGQRKLIAAWGDADVQRVEWVNDKRLVFYVQAPWETLDYAKWGTFAIDRDGEGLRQIISHRSDNEAATGSGIRDRALTRRWELWRAVGDGSDDVYVRQWLNSLDHGYRPQVVARLDTHTLRLTTVSDGQPEGAYHWLFDPQGQLRVVASVQADRRQLWWLPPQGRAWQKIDDQPLYEGAGFSPIAIEADGTLIVAARHRRDTQALHVYDLAKGRLDPEPLVAVQGYDVHTLRFDRRRRVAIGATVAAQRPTAVWFDEGLAKVQATVDKALPAGRANRLLCGDCVGAPRVVVHSEGDRQPGEYYLYDAASSRLTLIASTRPWVDEAQQGPRSHHRITARDGLSMPVVVTHPPGVPAGQPAPTVVLVHGGPWVDGADLTWEAEPAFLASRGYRVLQVSFRGTTGLGWKHERASWGQWGLSMQDDLEDAVLWAIGEKLTDPQRVCIYGASYGGYAALMGAVRHPGRYRCAVSHVGVTDLALLFSRNWTDTSQAYRTYGAPRLVGDPVQDAQRLRDTSPVHRVADIKVPVLIAQGRNDRRVSPEHADRFVAAARAAGVDIQRVDYEDGHGWWWPRSHEDFLGRLETFLAKHLKSH